MHGLPVDVLRDVMRPWFDFRFWHYIYCLLVYIVRFSSYPFFFTLFLTYLLPYLSFPLRLDPLGFQAASCKRRLNLASVFCLFCITVLFFWLLNACFCCARFIFSIPNLEKRLRNDLFCVVWDVKPQLNQSDSWWNVNTCDSEWKAQT